jgi:hypothetical protein
MTSQAEYLRGHKASKIHVGDQVKVLRKAESYEGEWDNEWCPQMDSSVGKFFEVVRDEGVGGFGLNDSIMRFAYPYFVLEKQTNGKEGAE